MPLSRFEVRRLIQEHQGEIIESWEQAVRDTLPSAQREGKLALMDRMPTLVWEISELFAEPEGTPITLEASREHGEFRARIEQYSLDEVLAEYWFLIRSILRVLEPAGALDPSSLSLLYDAIYQGIRQSVDAFISARRELESEANRLRFLQETTEIPLRGPCSMDVLLDETLGRLVPIFHSDVALVLLVSEDRQKLVLLGARGVKEAQAQRQQALNSEGMVARVLSERLSINIEDVESMGADAPILRSAGIHSAMLVPLSGRQQPEGVLVVGAFSARGYTSDDLRLLELIGQRLAAAMETVRLYETSIVAVETLTRERELRERFVASLGHDLRIPLTTIQSGAEWLASFPEAPEEQRHQMIQKILASSRRAEKMIRNLLDVTLIRAGQRPPLEIERCDLREVASQALDELATIYGERFRLEAPLRVSGFWSADGIYRAIENLVVNGIKYGDPQGIVTVRIDDRGPTVLVKVHNFGNELSPEQQLDVMRAARGAPSVFPRKGWGIGLMLVRGMAEALGGHLGIDSAPDRGTTFTIELPRDSRPFQTAELAA